MNCPVPDKLRDKFEKFLDNYLKLDFAPFFEWFVLEEALGVELTESEYRKIHDYAVWRWQNVQRYKHPQKEDDTPVETGHTEIAEFASLKFVAEN